LFFTRRREKFLIQSCIRSRQKIIHDSLMAQRENNIITIRTERIVRFGMDPPSLPGRNEKRNETTRNHSSSMHHSPSHKTCWTQQYYYSQRVLRFVDLEESARSRNGTKQNEAHAVSLSLLDPSTPSRAWGFASFSFPRITNRTAAPISRPPMSSLGPRDSPSTA